MGAVNLANITVTPLPQIQTPGGDVFHGMKDVDTGYLGFGEAYFSWVNEGFVKAWKRHTKMTMNLIVPQGRVQFVFRSIENDGVDVFRLEEIGINRYARITVPPGIWFGFRGVFAPKSLILNIANIPHDPCEVERLALTDINYDWNTL